MRAAPPRGRRRRDALGWSSCPTCGAPACRAELVRGFVARKRILFEPSPAGIYVIDDTAIARRLESVGGNVPAAHRWRKHHCGATR
jgi:hypothetical protein